MTDISEGIVLFNDGKFFEAHDYFENLWMEAEHSEKLFYQGLVQVSVGCYHLICGNYKGSFSQFNKGTGKLKNFVPNHSGVNLKNLIAEFNYLIESLTMYNSNSTPIDLSKIPKIEYSKIA